MPQIHHVQTKGTFPTNSVSSQCFFSQYMISLHHTISAQAVTIYDLHQWPVNGPMHPSGFIRQFTGIQEENKTFLYIYIFVQDQGFQALLLSLYMT